MNYKWKENDTVLFFGQDGMLHKGTIVEILQREYEDVVEVEFPPMLPDGAPTRKELSVYKDNFVVLVHEEDIPENTLDLMDYLSEQIPSKVILCKYHTGTHAFMACEHSLKPVFMREKLVTSHELRFDDETEDKWTREDGEIRESELVFVVEGRGDDDGGFEIETPDFDWDSDC